jgi:hypothetical protein
MQSHPREWIVLLMWLPPIARQSAVIAVDAARNLIAGWASGNTAPYIVPGYTKGDNQHQSTTRACKETTNSI